MRDCKWKLNAEINVNTKAVSSANIGRSTKTKNESVPVVVINLQFFVLTTKCLLLKHYFLLKSVGSLSGFENGRRIFGNKGDFCYI